MRHSICTIIIFMLLAATVNATIINVPADIDSIQGGIDMANHGDTVLVQPDTYVENINFNGRNIVVGSLFLTTGEVSYIPQTVIDGDSSWSVVTFENDEDSTAVLTGFTIVNGYAGWGGGGIACYGASPTLADLTVKGNIALFGGGIYCEHANPRMVNVIVTENTASSSCYI